MLVMLFRTLRIGLVVVAGCFVALQSVSALAQPDTAQPTRSPAQFGQPERTSPHLIEGRYAMPAVAVGTDIYVVEGLARAELRSDLERIDTTSAPAKVTSIPTQLKPRCFHTAEAKGPYIYVIGGNTQEGITAEVERFDTRDGSIKAMAPLPLALRAMASVIIGDKIYVVGGANNEGARVDNLLIYDIATDTWKAGAPLPEKKECELVPWQGGLLAIGGYLGPAGLAAGGKDISAAVHRYDIATNTWSALPSLPTPTSGHHALVVSDAKGHEQIVSFGDYVQPSRFISGNPIKGDWHDVKGIKFLPRRHNAVVEVKGNIYVIGGSTSDGDSYLDFIQIFDRKMIEGIPKGF
ncbi:hypothetical protein EON80_24555 [bacterium]|nr:MAG: hypothetical protein EON80_24555 [bacterium]